MERNIRKQKAKKLNNHQRLIAAICLVVAAILAISITFAWFTNRITLLNGKLTIGKFDYNVTVINQNKSEELNRDYTIAETDSAGSGDFTKSDLASGSVFYKLVKVTNRSSFPIKPYTYVSFSIDAQHENVPNYYYLRGYRVTEEVETAGSTDNFINTYSLPSSGDVASAGNSFGTANNNAVLLGTVPAGSQSNPSTEYYVVAYAVHNLPNTSVNNNYTLTIHPIVAVSQANAPSPATTSSQVFEVDTWQAFKTAIASAKIGDSIWLTDDVIGPTHTNLALTTPINLNLNGYDLTIHGNLSFTYLSNSDMRTLNVPLSSTLTVEGDLIIETPGSPFTIAGSGSSANIIIGKQGNSSLGKFKAYAGLDSTDGNTDPKPNSINENSGLIISDVQIKKYDGNSLVAADLEVTASNTMVKLTSGAVLNSVTATNGIENVYLVNYGTITSVDFSGMSYGTSRTVSVYVSNHNTINGITIPSSAVGLSSQDGTHPYNTRLINAPGCRTRFQNTCTFVSKFTSDDVEPIGSVVTLENKVVSNGNGKYTVSINTAFASGKNISDLFADHQPAYSVSDCTTLKIETNNGMELSTSNISNINSSFSNLTTLDLSSAAIYNDTIPANAFSGKTSLQNITFPVTSLSIDQGAFAGTSISKVTIPSNITSIGANAFNVASASLEVIWKASSAPTSVQLAAFNSSKTIMFMDASMANVMTNPNSQGYNAEWALNIYEEYQFKAGNFYCKYLPDGCQIIFYAGSLSAYNTNSVSGDSLIPDSLTGGGSDRAVVAIGRQAYKKAIDDDNGTSTVNLIFPATCTTVEDYAFQASSSSTLTSNIMTLNNVSSIGDSAFRYNNISTSTARPQTFNGMTKIGEYAFANTNVYGGCFDLSCVSDRTCTPAIGAFEDFNINGSSSSGNPYGTGNAYFSLANSGTIRADLATNMACYADFNLKGSGEIVANAFITCTIKTNAATTMEQLTTVVDVRNVLKIGHDAFKGIECGKFMIGNSSQLNDDSYEQIIGKTGSNGIKTFVLDGNLCVDNNSASSNGYYTITSKTANENVQIGTLEITTNTTCIQQGAFAGVVAKSGTGSSAVDTFDDEVNIHMQIGAVKTYDSAYTERNGHTFEIQARAFYGVLFTDALDIYNFEGVSEVGEKAFSCSSITELGLGHYITRINNPDFIAKCDNIDVLNIEYASDDDITALINNNSAANPNIINSDGSRRNGFEIRVPNNTPSGSNNDNLLAYIADTVWSGWKNYFKPLSRTIRCDANGSASATGKFYWEYYIIDPDDTSGLTTNKGIQIIGFTTTQTSTINYARIPAAIDGLPVTEVGGEGDVFKSLTVNITTLQFNNMQYLQYVHPDFLDTNRIRALSANTSTQYYTVKANYVLYRSYTKTYGQGEAISYELVRALPNPTSSANTVTPYTDNVGSQTVSVQTGAFKNCTKLKNFNANAGLKTIEAGAFDGSGIVNFNFTAPTSAVQIGQNALGSCREKQLGDDGYIYYKARQGFTITVPAALLSEYKLLPAFFMYDKYDCITVASGGASLSTNSGSKKLALQLKDEAFDTTIGGINYHVMNSGGKYNDIEYTSSKTDFIAVVTSLTPETAQAKTVVIPEIIVVDGVTYKVVGIDNAAFGTNSNIEKLVLPSSDIVYSSQTFANCSALGYIQFNDVAPFDASAGNSVASLPVASTQSLTENSRKDDDD